MLYFQISRTRKGALKGQYLPPDFRFSPTHGKSGPRTPWGGEIGVPVDVYNTPRKPEVKREKQRNFAQKTL